MKGKPIYVEVSIEAPVEEVWNASQQPELHEQWDLRFTSIRYLPKKDGEPQLFTYSRKAGPFIVEGWGKSSGSIHMENGTRSSSLHFGTDQKMSPIREGKGYWKYIPADVGTTFLTQYNYHSNFGKLGKLGDVLVVRPLIGYATAVSFDVLKRWLEKGETPKSQYMRFFMTLMTTVFFAFVWIYQGLVPKILAMHPQEKVMTANALSLSDLQTVQAVLLIGAAEVLFGLVWLLYPKKRHLFLVQLTIFPLLTAGALIASPEIASHPFNPVTFNLALIVLSAIGLQLSKDMPTAASCKRKR